MDWILAHPLTVLLLVTLPAAPLAWFTGSRGRLSAAALLAVGIALAVLGWSIDTPGESGERAVASLIDRAVAGDAAGAGAWFEPDAVIHFGGFDQPSMPRREIDRDLRSLEGRHRVEHHATLLLRGRTMGPDLAEVDVGCLTRTQSSAMSVLTTWSFRVRRQADGAWRIHAVSFDRLAGSLPRPGIF
ncbi:MAG: hypothetical protein EBQ99_02050 [Planctomycetes bacterium]|nr:hypothetical protein [Planctomycetota bacterium]